MTPSNNNKWTSGKSRLYDKLISKISGFAKSQVILETDVLILVIPWFLRNTANKNRTLHLPNLDLEPAAKGPILAISENMTISDERPPLGFISIDVILHRPPGDPFNEKTWPFPLIREKVDGSSEAQVVCSGPYDEDFINKFVDAGERLAKRGAVGIITSCGFLAMAQPELAARISIPIATSALIQIPSILAVLPVARSVGILTFDGTRLGPLHLSKMNIPPSRCHIQGAPEGGLLQRHIRQGIEYIHDEICAELVTVACELVAKFPDIAILCLECTQMPPFSEAIQTALQMPVYDVYTMGSWFYSGLASTRQRAWGPIIKDRVETRR